MPLICGKLLMRESHVECINRPNYQKWLDEGDKVDIWFRHQKGLTAMKRWIPITQWVGNARQELCSSKYDHLRKRCCEKTGCLITADGSEDVKITPEGLADYKVPPSLSYLPACEDESMSNTPDTIDNDEEKQEEETLDEDLEKPEIWRLRKRAMSYVDAKSKSCMKTVGVQEQFNISTKKWEDTEFCMMMTVRIT